MSMRTIIIFARDLRIDDIVIDDDGEHEVTCIDLPTMGEGTMGVTMHGEEEHGEFVYRTDERIAIRTTGTDERADTMSSPQRYAELFERTATQDYRALRVWHLASGSYDYYIDALVRRATDAQAPGDALYLASMDEWVTVRDLAADHPFRVAYDEATQ